MATTSDQNILHTCTGTDGSDFNISINTRSSTSYFVTASLESSASIYGIQMPTGTGDRTTSQFRVVTTAPVTAGDKIEFHVYEQTAPAVTQMLWASAWQNENSGTLATFGGNVWTLGSTGTNTGTVAVSLPVPPGATLTGVTLYDDPSGGSSAVFLRAYVSGPLPTTLLSVHPPAVSGWRAYALSFTPYTVASGTEVVLQYQPSLSTAGFLYGCQITYTLP